MKGRYYCYWTHRAGWDWREGIIVTELTGLGGTEGKVLLLLNSQGWVGLKGRYYCYWTHRAGWGWRAALGRGTSVLPPAGSGGCGSRTFYALWKQNKNIFQKQIYEYCSQCTVHCTVYMYIHCVHSPVTQELKTWHGLRLLVLALPQLQMVSMRLPSQYPLSKKYLIFIGSTPSFVILYYIY